MPARVVRVSPGEPVTIFDGHGNEAIGTVSAVQRRQVYVDFEDPRPVSREAKCLLTLAVSLPKGDRARVLVEKLTELGVARLIPLTCERTQGKQTGLNLDKLNRYVIEASKQCGRNQLMEVCQVRELADIITELPAAPVRWLAHPSGTTIEAAIDGDTEQPREVREATILIGPEGGFTDREVEFATESGWTIIALGARILRVETAAAAIAARLYPPVAKLAKSFGMCRSETRQEFRHCRSETRQEFRHCRSETRQEFRHCRSETRQEFRQCRSETRQEFRHRRSLKILEQLVMRVATAHGLCSDIPST